jgi:hypothetical protein
MKKTNKKILLLLIIIVATIMLFVLGYREFFNESSISSTVTFSNYKYNLALLVICKNEGMIIDEFIQHYKWQGVEHIYLIDNDSTDNMKEVLAPYITEGYLSYYFFPEQHKQQDHYNTVYNQIKNETKWLIICDADEYIYNKKQNNTIQSYINTLSENVNAVVLSWKMFGSSGNVTHPESIRMSFTWRQNDIHSLYKSIVQTKNVSLIGIHDHNYIETKELIKDPPELSLNHYAIMSEEYFRKVKMTRGDVHHKDASFQNIRDMNYFNQYDFKDIEDEELKNLLNNTNTSSMETFSNKYKYTLSLLVMSKNDGMILNEFIDHYQWQGVEHIYFIDNASTDNTYQVIEPYIKSGYVTYYYLPKQHSQVYNYNTVYNSIRNETKWLIICDTDEYMYNRSQYDSLLSFVEDINNLDINSIVLQWKMFGSSEYIEQPESIRKSFTMRKKEPNVNVKSIVRTQNTKYLVVHIHDYLPNTIIVNGSPYLALNHYAIMSKEYFNKVKMTRGSASTATSAAQYLRDENYFNNYDYKETKDEELKNLLEFEIDE